MIVSKISINGVVSHEYMNIWSLGGRVARACACGMEVSGSIPGRGGHKNLCGGREPSDYVSFRKAVKRQLFRTRNTYNTEPRTISITLPY